MGSGLETDAIWNVIGGVIAAIAGWLAGWLWSYYQYWKERKWEYFLEIELTPKVYSYGDAKLVDVEIKMQNRGGGAAFIKCPDPEGVQNPILEVKKCQVETRDSVVSWDSLPYLLPPIEFLKEFYHPRPDEPYIIEPGGTAIEHVRFTTSYDGVLVLRATLWDRRGYRAWGETVLDLRKS
jgi:hypothetical protein